MTEAILTLVQELVRIPSRGGVDDPAPILETIARWFKDADLPGDILTDSSGNPCAFYAETAGNGTGKDSLYILDACIDTADTGDLDSWSHDPFAAEVEDGWLYGRGAGDSKMGVSIFSHIFRNFYRANTTGNGRLGVLFDADEHTGRFGGVKRLLENKNDITGVCIGYPGMNELVIGARGFYRAKIRIPGRAGHTGMPAATVQNAARVGADFITHLYKAWESFITTLAEDRDFPFGPGMTVTEIHSGTAFSVVPDLCTVLIDFRLTHLCQEHDIVEFLDSVVSQFDGFSCEKIDTWPAYTLPNNHELAEGLGNAVEKITGHTLPRIYCGPSNIGNYLASYDIPATCGFGVICENFHAADERIRVDTIGTVYETYKEMVTSLIG
ncbi:MAG: M20 family metallopeptidase [Bacteroidetes bacterium]|nr:M20 family metallopeptidase [Bacteroidota bacterium]